MIFKFIFSLILMLIFVGQFQAQVWREIIPLKSNREDVDRLQVDKSQLPDGSTHFDLKGDTITIKYYNNECNAREETLLGISFDTVIQLKDVPKEIYSVTYLLGSDLSRFKKIQLSQEQNVYVDFSQGFIVVGENSEDREIVKLIYYIPKNKNLPICILNKMDVLVRQVEELGKNSEEEKQGKYLYKSISFNYPKFNSLNLKDLDLFIEIIKESKNTKGLIVVYASKEVKPNEAKFWIEKLKTYLLKELKIDKELIIVVGNGYRGKAEADLFIFPKENCNPLDTSR